MVTSSRLKPPTAGWILHPTVLQRSVLIGIRHAVDGRCREGLWELGGDRDLGLGNECIFNGKESMGSGVKVSSCIIDRTTDIETLNAWVAYAFKTRTCTQPHTCQSGNTCVHVLTSPLGITGCRRLMAGV